MKKNKRSPLKKLLSVVAAVVAAALICVIGYVAYVFAAFYRIGDATVAATHGGNAEISSGAEYTLVSYNIGFGAYEADYDFFMDGGSKSRAKSREALDKNLTNIAELLRSFGADLYTVQEVDFDSTRSYKTDEREYLTSALEGKSHAFAQNYDSPYLFYPLYSPHGASKSGLMTFSSFDIQKAERKELPIESGVTKLLDLDRCYSKCFISFGERFFVLYNFHLSAYTSDGKIANEQLKLMIGDMQSEYEAGNYAVAAGDFNKDILGDSSVYFGKSDKKYTWAQAIPDEVFDGTDVTLVAPLDEADPVPSCRNADSPYHEGQYVVTIDGFLLTPNVRATSAEVVDTGFAYSDHNPVKLGFRLI